MNLWWVLAVPSPLGSNQNPIEIQLLNEWLMNSGCSWHSGEQPKLINEYPETNIWWFLAAPKTLGSSQNPSILIWNWFSPNTPVSNQNSSQISLKWIYDDLLDAPGTPGSSQNKKNNQVTMSFRCSGTPGSNQNSFEMKLGYILMSLPAPGTSGSSQNSSKLTWNAYLLHFWVLLAIWVAAQTHQHLIWT